MRYYVYALIDPSNNDIPFYIGKGLDNRLQQHFQDTITVSGRGKTMPVIGCDTNSIVEDSNLNKIDKKSKCLHYLYKLGFNHTDIARVIAKNLNENCALTLESCLIKNVYGLENLVNDKEGHKSNRFRDYNYWNFIPGYDIQFKEIQFTEPSNSGLGNHYVYVLRNPQTGAIFYVGKGTKNRLYDHFLNVYKNDKFIEKTLEIKSLLKSGFSPQDIACVVAWVDDEHEAYTLESFYLKFVYGLNELTNIQDGKHTGNFRSKGDWERRKGFDLPFVVNPGQRTDRSEKLDGMLGEGLDQKLLCIQASFPNLDFEPPKILDSSDLGIEALVGMTNNEAGVRIKIFIRKKRIQIELRPRTKAQRNWIINHFKKLKAYPLRRADDVFFPNCWRGSRNMTQDTNEAIRRVNLLLEIVSAKKRDELSREALSLLD